MVRGVFVFVIVASSLATGALAQSPQFSNPTPIDFSKPFLFDGLSPTQRQTTPSSRSIPVEAIPSSHRPGMIQLPPTLNYDDIPTPLRTTQTPLEVIVLPVEPAPEPKPGR